LASNDLQQACVVPVRCLCNARYLREKREEREAPPDRLTAVAYWPSVASPFKAPP
jgi:hypothetical protein